LIGLKKCIGFPILNKNMKPILKSHRVYSINYSKGQTSVYTAQPQQSSRPLWQAARELTHLPHVLQKEAVHSSPIRT
jgi:hypothetical protein